MAKKRFIDTLITLFIAALVLMTFQSPVKVLAQENQPSKDASYDIALTLVRLKDLNGWPKGGGTDSYSGEPLNINDYFGKEASTIDGVFFELRKDSATGEVVQTAITANGGQLLFKSLKEGKYYLVANKEKSKIAANEILGDSTPVPLEVNLPVFKATGGWFTTGQDAVHVYPKQVVKQRDDKTSFKVRKEWKGKKLAGIKVHLKQNGKIIDEIELNSSNKWEYTFTNLTKKNAEGKDFEYTAEEDVPKDYTAAYTVLSEGQAGVLITNTYTPPKTPIIKTGTLVLYWVLGIAVVLMGFGYKLSQDDKNHKE